MSFYDDASLVFLAGGAAGKDGKAYSLKPTDGSGDFTFTRGTNLTATRVGKDGYIEKGRENLLLQSNQFDTTWTLNSASLTSGQAGYDGSNDAWELKATGDGVTNLARLTQGSLSVSGISTFSVYVKAGNTDFVRINLLTSGSPNCNNYFDVANGSVGSSPSGSVAHSSITAAGNGFYRIALTHDGSGGSINEVRIQVADADGDDIPATGSFVYIQDAQLESGLVATDYIETGATTATAGLLEDEPRFDYTGGGCPALLMEPTRTNELPHSEYFTSQAYWQLNSDGIRTDNAAVSPEGIENATSLESEASEYNILRSAPVSLDTSTEYVFSFYAKNVDATNAHYRVYNTDSSRDIVSSTSYISQLSTTEWKRIEVSFTTESVDTNYSVYFASGNLGGKILIWGAQLEKGSYATSYMPNYGAAATVTRSGDACYLQNAVVHSSGTGTIFFEIGDYDTNTSASGFNKILVFNEVATSSIDNVIYFEEYAGDNTILIRKGGSNLLQTTPSYQNLRGSKIAIKWSSEEAKVFIDGVLNKTYTGDASLDIQYFGFNAQYNGGIVSTIKMKQLAGFPTALTDTECIALTTV